MSLTVTATDQLVTELLSTSARGMKWHLRHLDRKRRLVYFRNMQQNGRWQTRYVLPTLGYRVTLDEELDTQKQIRERFRRARYRTVAARIEPLA